MFRGLFLTDLVSDEEDEEDSKNLFSSAKGWMSFDLILCMLGNFSCFCCCLLTMLKINFFFQKKPFTNTIRVSNALILIMPNVRSILIWFQIVCKGNQQKTKVAASKERDDIDTISEHMIRIRNFCKNLKF